MLAIFDLFFFFNDTATTEIYTLSLHDALPISLARRVRGARGTRSPGADHRALAFLRSEEHTSELQSQSNLVCRLLLEKKKNKSLKESTSQLSLLNSRSIFYSANLTRRLHLCPP